MYSSFLAAAALAAPVVFAQSQASCGGGQLCPSDTPCCSAYGQCGLGAYCLGGCDPINSFSLDSCVPSPVCSSTNDQFNDLSTIVDQKDYLGDGTKANWVSQGQPLEYNGNVLLTMAQGTVGTLLASTKYVWYGKINARFQTSAGQGVVTAFILMSDVKDEIDFEFVGTDLQTAQTNFYSQGVTNYNNGGKTGGLTDTRANYHDYEIDWQPDTLTWSIDGKVVRTLKKSETWNATANRYTYPQTPSRVMLSLWPAGLASNGEGTIEWAGGLVNWGSQYMTNGYYYAPFDSVSIQCYNPPSGANVAGSKSYIYTNKAGTNNTVQISNDPTVLTSLLGSGTDMGKDYPGASANTSSSNQAVIPGLSGAGAGANGQRGNSDTSSGTTSSGSGSGSGSGSSSGSNGKGSSSNGFYQGGDTNNAPGGEKALQGSLFAVVVAIVGLCML